MKFRLSSEFGELAEVRNNEPHHGIDFAMPEGTTLRSVADGVVERVLNEGELGKGVFVRHDDGTLSIYGHLKEIAVKQGEHVNAGETLGLSGNTGLSTGPHLHFAMKDGSGEWVDPTPIAEQVSNAQGSENWLLEKYNGIADWVIGKEMDFVVNPFVGLIRDGINALTDIMPEIGALITIACAVCIMLTGNFAKYFTRWMFGMVGVIAWLLNA
jgi:murein DD-endopeptidase MepM/ murein hydrolase activator NlpD